MGFEKTGRVGLGDNAQPNDDEDSLLPPPQPIPPVKEDQED